MRMICETDITGWREISLVTTDGIAIEGRITDYTSPVDSTYGVGEIDVDPGTGLSFNILESDIVTIEKIG